MSRIFSLFFLLLFGYQIHGQQSPQQFLITKFGQRYTPHHLIVSYLEQLDQSSDNIQVINYGYTNEDRPLKLAIISSKKNMANLDKIRKQHLASLGLSDEKNNILKEDIAIVWLGFGVHGNEASCTEAAINTAYQLLVDPKATKWLENTIVIIDPNANPDGHDRYVNWIRGVNHTSPHVDISDREHNEPWPQGRTNHYLFDLNRDWAWQTQKESQAKVQQFRQWQPHVFADFHEMFFNESYYFAPAAQPFHQAISPFQYQMQDTFGRNHAKYFDQNGWMYFTKEIFDLYYPSYGDTYPMFNGAIGMTYEQAGHSMSGNAILTNTGDTLTLAQRIAHHTTVALSTVETTSKNANALVRYLQQYYNLEEISKEKMYQKYKTYILKNNPRLDRLATLLDNNGIKYQYADASDKTSGYSYNTDKNQGFTIEKGDMLITAIQPQARLVHVLFNPHPLLSDSLTYDITSWALPFAYGLEAYATSKEVKMKTMEVRQKSEITGCNAPYAYIIPWESISAVKALGTLQKNGINVRSTLKDAIIDQTPIKPGSLIVLQADNRKIQNFNETIKTLLANSTYQCVETGYSNIGKDLGGSNYRLLKAPKALLVTGKHTNANEVGHLWHYFDEVIDYPLSMLDQEDIDWSNVSKFNTIIIPDGSYSFSAQELEQINQWAKSGGKLIMMGGGLDAFAGQKDYGLSKYATDEEKENAEKEEKQRALDRRLAVYGEMERSSVSSSMPGAIIENKVDKSHPLCFGLGDKYYSLKTTTNTYKWLKECWNPIAVDTTFRHIGFIGKDKLEEIKGTTTVSIEPKGRGTIVYFVDLPLFRGFWEIGLLLMANGLFMVE